MLRIVSYGGFDPKDKIAQGELRVKPGGLDSPRGDGLLMCLSEKKSTGREMIGTE